MTLVGKICVVAILIMSVVFMGFAMSVYSAHTNWMMVVERTRDQATAGQPLGLRYQLEDKENEIAELKLQLEKLDAEHAAMVSSTRQQLAKLETVRDELLAEREQAKTELASLEEANRKLSGNVDEMQANLTRVTDENGRLRQEIRVAQQERDEYFTKSVSATEKLHGAHGELKAKTERLDQLLAQVGIYRAKLTEVGVKNPDAPLAGTPPAIKGLVTAVRGDTLIEVSIGSDDGLREGHTLEVYRAQTYLGRALIVKATADRAVAKILPDYRRGVIQKGDYVATRLKLS